MIKMNNTNAEFLQYVKLIADENHIPRDTVIDGLKDAINKAYAKEFPESVIEINIDLDKSILEVNSVLNVVEPYDDLNDYTEITLGDAQKYDTNVQVGQTLRLPVNLAKLDRPIVTHILQVFKHNIYSETNRQIHKD
jgi:N utilization substance protein A